MEKMEMLRYAAEEADQRGLRFRDVEIVDYEPSQSDETVLCPAGSITLFFARRGDSTIARIRDAAVKRSDADRELARELRAQYEGREPLTPDQAWEVLRQEPVFASVRSGAKTIATNLFLPEDLRVGILPFPHNGGRLPSEYLTLVEHFDEERADQAFDAVALRFPGALTPVEAAALEQLPEEKMELNIATNGSCCPDVTGMVILVLMTLALAVQREIEHIPDSRIAELSPEATARELMAIRREALGHSH